jgi:hypothetical protein
MNVVDEHTLEDHKLWRLVTVAWEALGDYFKPEVGASAQARGLSRQTWRLLLATLACEPDPVSSADLMVRKPFTAAEVFSKRLQQAEAQGYLVQVEPGNFRLSEIGRKETEHLMSVARAAIDRVDPLPRHDGERLSRLFKRLVQSCLETPPPPSTWSIQASYNLMPSLDPPLPYVEQAMTCLLAYWDDSHLAAWRFTNLSATALETLSCLWRHEGTNLDEICEKLANHGHPCATYERAIAELRDRNFVEGPDSSLQVTNGGRIFRNEVEEDTHRFFFAPWKVLSFKEKTDFAGLLIRLKQGLQSPPQE